LELKPFDPADYLDSEEGIEAYLADARLDGPAAMARAMEVVARARARMAGSRKPAPLGRRS
jgi:DNA-binding phage protein